MRKKQFKASQNPRPQKRQQTSIPLVQLEEKGMFLFEQTWIPSPWNFICHNKTRTHIFVMQVAALGTRLISHPCQEPPGFIRSKEATKQDKIPSQLGCLAARAHVEQQQLCTAPRRALRVRIWQILSTARPREAAGAEAAGLGAECLGMHTQT